MSTYPDLTTRKFNSFRHIVVPITEDMSGDTALNFAHTLIGRITLIGLVRVSMAASLSTGAAAANALRRRLRTLGHGIYPVQVIVSHTPWDDLAHTLQADPPDLLILDWPTFFESVGISATEAMRNPPCDVALIRGPWPIGRPRVLVPLRGGPYAELSLRVGLTVPASEVVTLHLRRPDTTVATEAPFQGLADVLPYLPEIIQESAISEDPGATLLERVQDFDVVIMGASAPPFTQGEVIGVIAQRMLREATGTVVVVKTRRTPPRLSATDGAAAGASAISVLVDKWFAENTFVATDFEDLDHLVDLKRGQGLTISLALPALNEEKTVGKVIQTIKQHLMDDTPLIDEIVLIDSHSTDRTRDIALDLGVEVYIHQELLPGYGARVGKGEALWKSLLVTRGDIIAWIDTDIVNIHPRFVYGLLGPLLVSPHIEYTKGFYRRPLKVGDKIQAGGGGRVTELTARPLLNLFYPQLSGIIQPLSGEYAGRRRTLERMAFESGYGVETGLLIDIFEQCGLRAIAQVDLLERVHHNQELEALGKMSFAILQTVIRRRQRRTGHPLFAEVNMTMKLPRFGARGYYIDVVEVDERFRPPMLELPEYTARLEHMPF